MFESLRSNAVGVRIQISEGKGDNFTGSVHIIHTFLTGNNIWFSRRLFDVIELSGISLMKGNTLVCLSVGDILPCA